MIIIAEHAYDLLILSKAKIATIIYLVPLLSFFTARMIVQKNEKQWLNYHKNQQWLSNSYYSYCFVWLFKRCNIVIIQNVAIILLLTIALNFVEIQQSISAGYIVGSEWWVQWDITIIVGFLISSIICLLFGTINGILSKHVIIWYLAYTHKL